MLPLRPTSMTAFEVVGAPAQIEFNASAEGVVEGITFAYNSDEVTPKSRPVLDDAAKVFKEYSVNKILITGHTDDQGERQYNLDLSARRADAVKAYLVKAGVPADSLDTRGAGPDEPRADNKTPEGQQKNRRIEFKILSQ